jgi:protein-disulfide isomerase
MPKFSTVAIAGLVLFSIAASFFLGSFWTRLGGFAALQGTNVAGTGTGAVQPAGAQPSAPVDVKIELSKNDHVRGNREARIVLVEYSDFECPFCARFHPTAQQVLSEYGNEVMWVYRHFPLTSIHPSAQELALASECIFEQGGDDAFWNYADSVFSDGFDQYVGNYGELVSNLGLDVTTFNSCLESEKYADRVNSDASSGAAIGVNGTPGNFVVNLDTGEVRELRGAVPFDTVKQAIDGIL